MILGHKVLDGLIDLFSCLDDHIVDIHVGSNTIRFVKVEVSLGKKGLSLRSLESRSSGIFLLNLGLELIFFLLLEVYNLYRCQLELDFGSEVVDVFDCLHELVLVFTTNLEVDVFLLSMSLNILAETTISFLHLVKLFADLSALELHSIKLKLVDDVLVVFFLHIEKFLHFT